MPAAELFLRVALVLAVSGFAAGMAVRVRALPSDTVNRAAGTAVMGASLGGVFLIVPMLLGVRRLDIVVITTVASIVLSCGSFFLFSRALKGK